MDTKYDAFLKRVAKMRAEQREYFITRSQKHLRNSKQLEKLVDDEITNYFNKQLELNF